MTSPETGPAVPETVKESRANQMPFVECPECHTTFQWDDFYVAQIDSEIECNCGATLVVTSKECVMWLDFEVKHSAPPEQEKKS